jgi:antitoxin ParD1/3/4
MNVSLTPRLEEMIREKVDSGLYNNASEVVREALRLLDEHDAHLEALRAALIQGERSGPSTPLDVDQFLADRRAVRTR